MTRTPAVLVAAILALHLPHWAAADQTTPPSTQALPPASSVKQSRGLGQELALGLGTLPMNTSGKGLSVYGSFAIQPWRYLGWEVVGGFFFVSLGDDPRQELTDRFDVQATESERLRAAFHSSLFVQPLSGHFSLPGDIVVAGDLRFQLGYALASYTTQIAHGFNAGLRLRIRIDPVSSIGLDLREYIFFSGAHVQHNLYLGFAFIIDLTQGR